MKKFVRTTKEIFDLNELNEKMAKAHEVYAAALLIFGTRYKDGAWHVPEPVGIKPEEEAMDWIRKQMLKGGSATAYEFLYYCGFAVNDKFAIAGYEFEIEKITEMKEEEEED